MEGQFRHKIQNEQEHFVNTLVFTISEEARRDHMISDYYILMQYIVKVGLKRFEEDDQKATMKIGLYQTLVTREVFGKGILPALNNE